MKFFVGGTPVDYSGAREYDALLAWIEKKTGPASKALETDEDLESHSSAKLSVLYLLPEGDEAAMKAYTSFAAGYDDVSFAHSHKPAHSEKLEVTGKYTLVVFRTFDSGNQFLSEDSMLSSESMKTFLESNRFPIVSEFDQEAANRIFGGQLDAMFLLTDSDDGEAVVDFRAFAKARKAEGDDLVFAISKISDGLG